MASIRFVPGESIRFYDSVNDTFHDTNYLFNKLEENAETLEIYNKFYLAIPLIQHEAMEEIWQSNFTSTSCEIVYHVMMKFKEWGSFVYKQKVTPTATTGYLTDTNPDSQYFERKFLLIRLADLCGRLSSTIEYQFAVYATYLDMTTGETYITRDECDDITSNFVAINSPTTPYVFDCENNDGWFDLKVSLSKSVSFATPGVSVYEILCFTNTLQLNGNDPTLIRAETIELMGEVRTFDIIDPEASTTNIPIYFQYGTPSSSTAIYIDKTKVEEKNAKSIYIGVRLRNDAYDNSTDPDYSTFVTRDWFRIDVDQKLKTSTISFTSFSSNFASLVDTNALDNGRYAIRSGSDRPLIATIDGTFSSDCKFYLDMGLFTKVIELEYDATDGKYKVNLSKYSRYFIPKIVNDDYAITYDEASGYSSTARRDNVELLIAGSYGSKRYDIRDSFYDGVTGGSYSYVQYITNIYDYDLLRDKSLYMESDTQRECIVFDVVKNATSTATGSGRFMIKNPFYYYYQRSYSLDESIGRTPYVEYVNNNSIIKNEEVYARIIYSSSLKIDNISTGATYTSSFKRDDNTAAILNNLYGGFMLTDNIPYSLGVNDFTLTIIADDSTELVSIPFTYVGTEASEAETETPTFSIKPGIGVGINYDMRDVDYDMGLVVNGDMIVHGTLYKRIEDNWSGNVMSTVLPFADGSMGVAAAVQGGTDIVYVDGGIHKNVSFADYMLEDMGIESTLSLTFRDCKIYVEERASLTSSIVNSVLVDCTYSIYNSSGDYVLKRYVGRYTRGTANSIVYRYPMLNTEIGRITT